MGKNKRNLKHTIRRQPAKLIASQDAKVIRRQHSQQGKVNFSKQPSTQHQKLKPKIPFCAQDCVLLVGEGDFSFSLALVRHHDVGAIVATSFDDENTLHTKYPKVTSTLHKLTNSRELSSSPDHNASSDDSWRGFSPAEDSGRSLYQTEHETSSSQITILHGIDATSLNKKHRKALSFHAPFTKIAFNFPHVGGLSTDVNRQVRANQQLLVEFFNSAKSLLATSTRPARGLSHSNSDEWADEAEFQDGDTAPTSKALSTGQIIVTLFEGEPYTLWNIRDLARHCGLQVVESFQFPWEAYPEYKHARTIGDITSGKDRSDEGKRKGAWRGEERQARSYLICLKDEVAGQGSGSKKRKRNSDSDDSD